MRPRCVLVGLVCGCAAQRPAPALPAPADDLVAQVRARLPTHAPACEDPAQACEARGDLDGDGASDRVVLVRPEGGGALGLAILWGRGGADLLGGGRSGQSWTVLADEERRSEAIPEDLEFLARWELCRAAGPPGERRGFTQVVRGSAREHAAPDVRGDGILLDGGDSAAVAYHDGAGWRLIYLGF